MAQRACQGRPARHSDGEDGRGTSKGQPFTERLSQSDLEAALSRHIAG
jgi:hypothetical protein